MVYWKIDSYLTVPVLENRLLFNSTCTGKYPLPYFFGEISFVFEKLSNKDGRRKDPIFFYSKHTITSYQISYLNENI